MAKHVKEPTAVGNPDGTITVILPEDFYDDNHPLVKAHPDKFIGPMDGVNVIAAPVKKSKSDDAGL